MKGIPYWLSFRTYEELPHKRKCTTPKCSDYKRNQKYKVGVSKKKQLQILFHVCAVIRRLKKVVRNEIEYKILRVPTHLVTTL